MEYTGAGGKLIHEKNQKQKISRHCPFKGRRSCANSRGALQINCTENLKQIFSDMKIRGLVPNFYIHVGRKTSIVAMKTHRESRIKSLKYPTESRLNIKPIGNLKFV
jgi:hypothetical protein